jgi:hypothetical protein
MRELLAHKPTARKSGDSVIRGTLSNIVKAYTTNRMEYIVAVSVTELI